MASVGQLERPLSPVLDIGTGSDLEQGDCDAETLPPSPPLPGDATSKPVHGDCDSAPVVFAQPTRTDSGSVGGEILTREEAIFGKQRTTCLQSAVQAAGTHETGALPQQDTEVECLSAPPRNLSNSSLPMTDPSQHHMVQQLQPSRCGAGGLSPDLPGPQSTQWKEGTSHPSLYHAQWQSTNVGGVARGELRSSSYCRSYSDSQYAEARRQQDDVEVHMVDSWPVELVHPDGTVEVANAFYDATGRVLLQTLSGIVDQSSGQPVELISEPEVTAPPPSGAPEAVFYYPEHGMAPTTASSYCLPQVPLVSRREHCVPPQVRATSGRHERRRRRHRTHRRHTGTARSSMSTRRTGLSHSQTGIPLEMSTELSAFEKLREVKTTEPKIDNRHLRQRPPIPRRGSQTSSLSTKPSTSKTTTQATSQGKPQAASKSKSESKPKSKPKSKPPQSEPKSKPKSKPKAKFASKSGEPNTKAEARYSAPNVGHDGSAKRIRLDPTAEALDSREASAEQCLLLISLHLEETLPMRVGLPIREIRKQLGEEADALLAVWRQLATFVLRSGDDTRSCSLCRSRPDDPRRDLFPLLLCAQQHNPECTGYVHPACAGLHGRRLRAAAVRSVAGTYTCTVCCGARTRNRCDSPTLAVSAELHRVRMFLEAQIGELGFKRARHVPACDASDSSSWTDLPRVCTRLRGMRGPTGLVQWFHCASTLLPVLSDCTLPIP